ncbi:MAG: hypothetical protein JWM85_2220, partial [Acidimicrobiaceae bacterium]|nr:hypothetical protein [Acidimicrobiaceae bacterium]
DTQTIAAVPVTAAISLGQAEGGGYDFVTSLTDSSGAPVTPSRAAAFLVTVSYQGTAAQSTFTVTAPVGQTDCVVAFDTSLPFVQVMSSNCSASGSAFNTNAPMEGATVAAVFAEDGYLVTTAPASVAYP